MARAAESRRSGVPWWTPLILLALLAGGVAAAVASSRSGGPTSTGRVLGTRAVVTHASHVVEDRTLVAGGHSLLPLRGGSLETLVGRHATARGVRVLGVVGDRIFWVGTAGRSQLLVHLQGRGTRYAIRTGQRLAFTGTLARNAGGSASAWGLDPSEGRVRFVRAGVHIEVYGPRIKFR